VSLFKTTDELLLYAWRREALSGERVWRYILLIGADMLEIENRRSIRKYKNLEVEETKMHQLLESARLAPSGNNTQPWHFIVIDDRTLISRIAEAANGQKWINTAPVIIACIADIGTRINDTLDLHLNENSELFELKQIIRDTAIAVEHIVLEAVHQGLGTCWVSWYKQEDLRPILGIPEDKFVVTVLTVGYPDENPKLRPRKDISRIYHRNSW
jgi:nitroreductase